MPDKYDDELIEVGRRAIEDVLVDFRDSRLSVLRCGNGLVIREKDGDDSSTIRLTVEQALRIGIDAMNKAALAAHSAAKEKP